jgi:hypothetical protein
VFGRKLVVSIVVVYVDNLLICGESDRGVEIVKTQFKHHFTMTVMEYPKVIVGWNINKISNGITIDYCSLFRRPTH